MKAGIVVPVSGSEIEKWRKTIHDLRDCLQAMAQQRSEHSTAYFSHRINTLTATLESFQDQPPDGEYSFQYIHEELARLGALNVSVV